MDKKKLKIVFTFGCGTKFAGKVVIIECDEIMTAIDYIFRKYGQQNVAFEYHYDKESLENYCAYKKGLFEELKNSYDYGKKLVKKYNYEILEHKILED